MNNVILIGRLTKDPELAYTPNTNTAVCHFNLAVDRQNKEQGTDFLPIVVWEKTAENCGKYLSKGRQVAVMGRIETGTYEKNGERHYKTEIVASRVEFLGSSQAEPDTGFNAVEDKIPF